MRRVAAPRRDRVTTVRQCRRLNLSPAVVVLSLFFWSWLLGVSGALLAVPLSLGAKFLFENLDETRWIAHVMSDAKPAPAAQSAPAPPSVQ